MREALAVRRNILCVSCPPLVRLPTCDVALTCLSRPRFLDRYKVTVGRVCNNVSEMLILVRTDVPPIQSCPHSL